MERIKVFKELNKIDEELVLYEMANAVPKDTKLPYTIWVDSAGKNRNVPHNDPRLKVEVEGDFIPVSISMNPKILADGKEIKKFKLVKQFIIRHYEELIKHWNKEISDRELLNLLVED